MYVYDICSLHAAHAQVCVQCSVQTHRHIWMFYSVQSCPNWIPGAWAHGLKWLVQAVSLVLCPAVQQLCPLLHCLFEPSLTFLFTLCKAGAKAAALSSAHKLSVLRAKPCSAHVLTVISHR